MVQDTDTPTVDTLRKPLLRLGVSLQRSCGGIRYSRGPGLHYVFLKDRFFPR